MTYHDDKTSKSECVFKVLKVENNKATIKIYRDSK